MSELGGVDRNLKRVGDVPPAPSGGLTRVGDVPAAAPKLKKVGEVAFNSFETSLAEVENAQKVGFKDDVWSPHASPEGGLDTIGYGHKITQAEEDAGTYKKGISDADAIKLFRADIKKHADIVRKDVEDFDDLPKKYQDVLVNIAFNTGSVKANKWPSLLKAMRAGDDKKVREESVTSFTDASGKKGLLKTRSKKIADAAGLGS